MTSVSFLQNLLRPFIRWMISQRPELGVWEKEDIIIPFNFVNKFRKDVPSDFRHFTSGNLAFHPKNLEEMDVWLKGCEYVTDKNQFGKKDYWQHPLQFEQDKRGDCEDHSLWAWRVLQEMGFNTEFVIGNLNGGGLHAWVHFYKGEDFFLMEPTAKKSPIVLSFDEVKNRYVPYWSVDGNFKTYLYGGYMKSLKG